MSALSIFDKSLKYLSDVEIVVWLYWTAVSISAAVSPFFSVLQKWSAHGKVLVVQSAETTKNEDETEDFEHRGSWMGIWVSDFLLRVRCRQSILQILSSELFYMPKYRFIDFYALAMLFTSILLILRIISKNENFGRDQNGTFDDRCAVVLFLFLCHSARRFFEQLYLFPKSLSVPNQSRMHIVAYFLGLRLDYDVPNHNYPCPMNARDALSFVVFTSSHPSPFSLIIERLTYQSLAFLFRPVSVGLFCFPLR